MRMRAEEETPADQCNLLWQNNGAQVRNLRSLRSCSQSLLHCAMLCNTVQIDMLLTSADSVQNLGSHRASLGIVIQDWRSSRQWQPLSICTKLQKTPSLTPSIFTHLYTVHLTATVAISCNNSCNTKRVCIKV